jgi:peptidoglycan/LPS O-acetylase OafA/YrhL
LTGPALQDSPRHDVYLDWMRGVAALLVFFAHVRNGFFVPWSALDTASQTPLNELLFFVTRLGREAVIVFFVLSGYLVGGQAFGELRAGRYSMRRYLIARIARLQTVLLPALVLTSLCDALRHAWTVDVDGWHAFIINLFFLQGVFGPLYGSNGPLWSLAYEWWFYIVFGMGIALAARPGPGRTALLVSALCVLTVVLWQRCPAILGMMPLWLAGVAVRTLPVIRSVNRWLPAIAGVVLVVCLGVSGLRQDYVGDCLVGVATCLLIYTVRPLPPLSYRWFPLGKGLAAFSFTLYAFHSPLNVLVESILVPQRLTVASPGQWLSWAVLVLGVSAVCYALYWGFERQTPVVRRMLESIWPGAPAQRGARVQVPS